MTTKLTLDTDKIRMITLFENVTKSRIKDCIMNDGGGMVCFVVEEGKIGTAIGKDGRKVKRVEQMIGRNIKLFEFSSDISTFVKNMIPQTKAIKIRNENGRVIVEIKVEKKDRPFVIGRDKRNLNFYKNILQRNHDIDDLVVR
jgi:N utilization substance protein A